MKKLLLVFAVLLSCASFLFAEDSAPAWLTAKFGETLIDANGKDVKVSSLKGKIIGIYFSAHWCPPCRQFTPQLVKFRDENSKKFEVVFVSFDRNEAAMNEYMTEMKMQWPALKLKGEKAMALVDEFHVSGIPRLVILDKKGRVVSQNGRGELTADPKGVLKKWRKPGKKADKADKTDKE